MDTKLKFKTFIIYVTILVLILTGCSMQVGKHLNTGALKVHYIDVGQGDSILVQLPNDEVTLIDGGPRSSSDTVTRYLEKLEIEKIDYLVATHPHEDHIGGLPEVIKNFDIGNVYMPDRTNNTVIFEELLLQMKEKDKKINIAKAGDILVDNENLKYEFIAPNGDKYSNTNDYSIVAKITYGSNSFLFTGDAEKASEEEMVASGYDLSSDVLKVGHHGSSTSTTEKFLKEVQPGYGVISSGAGNSYGHPHKEVMEILNEYGVEILRTDELGTIVINSDGEEITIDKGETDFNQTKGKYYIGNKNTKVFHNPECGSLPKKENRIKFNTIKEAKDNGFRPHDKCVE